MATQNSDELLKELTDQASDIRGNNSSVTTGIRKEGEEPTEETEQDIEIADDLPDEEVEKSRGDSKEDPVEEEIHKSAREFALERVIERQEREFAEKENEFKDKLTEFEKAKTEERQREIRDEIKILADELKLDADGLTKIFGVVDTIVERKLKDVSPSPALMADYEARQESAHFDGEWRSAIPFINETYPKSTTSQIEEAKELMDSISHSEQGGRVVKLSDGKERFEPYELDYIMWKHKDEFDRVLTPSKRYGIESANRRGYVEEHESSFDPSSAKSVEERDKLYRDAAANSTLHREDPSARFI